ncbi:MAG: LytTR family transcriptional regulator DNA-binding domain-containing protein [Brevundimonas sp.]|uniref:LytTR family DNA-binding domain-containing protein n=1 Tax=Brevundimonas sp. TaxID=1871086 RepID=UPI00391C8B35
MSTGDMEPQTVGTRWSLPAFLRPELLRGLAWALAVGFFLAISGAFNTANTSLGQRIVYWTLMMILGGLWGHASSAAICRVIDLRRHPLTGAIVQVLVISGPLSVIIWFASGLFFRGRPYPLEYLGGFIVPVLAITALLTGINLLREMRQPAARPEPAQPDSSLPEPTLPEPTLPEPTLPELGQPSPPADGPAALMDRLPHRLRAARLLAIEAEDHYLRLHTDQGSDLVLMRLSDAVRALATVDGAQTHRSWWVARDAIVSVERDDGRATLTLISGLKVPVSRTHAKALRDRGFL